MTTTNNEPKDNGEQDKLTLVPPQPEKRIITILGTQGLSVNDYSIAELKILLKLVEHTQKTIIESVIPQRLGRDYFPVSPEVMAEGHVKITMKLCELGFGGNHLLWLRGLLKKMERKGIEIPFKVGEMTSYSPYPQLFKSEVYKNRKGIWMVTFRLDKDLLRFFYSFDKGAGRIDLNAVNACKGTSSIKMYIIMNCWASKGYTCIKPDKLIAMLHGSKTFYKSWSTLEHKALKFACKDLKRLYDNHLIDQYLSYQPFFNDTKEHQRHAMPEHITFTIHDRRNSGNGDLEQVSEELRGRRSQLKMLLTMRYGVTEETAKKLSMRLSLDMLGELNDWFQHKNYYIEKCKAEHHKMNIANYIAKGLDGFFNDKNV